MRKDKQERINDIAGYLDNKGTDYWFEGYWRSDETFLKDLGFDVLKIEQVTRGYQYIELVEDQIEEMVDLDIYEN